MFKQASTTITTTITNIQITRVCLIELNNNCCSAG